MACALCAAGLIAPAGPALADTGGAAYRDQTARQSSRAPSPTSSSRHLGDRLPVRRGMRGHDVKILQDFMNRIGLRVALDGSFGRQTWAALRRVERRAGRPVDGVLDAGDLAALRQAVARGGWSRARASGPPTPPAPAPAELPPGSRAQVGPDGLAAAPADAPPAVKAIIAAGNEIATKPYRYGGGHGRWQDSGYDCSGSVSYALHGAGLLDAARPSGGFVSYGDPGPGSWVTIYANGGHMYMVVAGLRFDTSGRSSSGSRWQSTPRTARGYTVRHPPGL